MKDDKKKLEYYAGHSREFTRRQFMFNAGLTSVVSALSLSNLPNLFASRAFAESSVGRGGLPFVSLECAGGINIGGNVIIGRDSSGTQDEWSTVDSYLFLGFPAELHPSRSGMVDESFGLKFHKTSGILMGMKQVLDGKTVSINGVETLISDMVDGLFFAYRSADDTSGNPINTSIPVVKAGARGRLVNLIGTSGSSNGGFSETDSAVYDPALRPPVVANLGGAKSLVSLGLLDETIDGRTKDADSSRLMNRISELSRKRIEMMSNRKLTSTVKGNINDALKKTNDFFTQFSANELDYSQVDGADINKVFHGGTHPLFPGVNLAADRDSIGTISYLLLHNNLVGSAIIGVGGGDYHDGTAATGVRKDHELGRYIGEMIYYAALKGKSLVLDLFTDGSAICSTSGVLDSSPTGQGKVVHHTDSPIQSGSIMLVYRHGKTREAEPIVKFTQSGATKTPLRQIGSFLPGRGGGVDLSANSMANNINMVWRIKMLNYLALMEPTNSPEDVVLKFESIYGRGLLAADAKDLIRFNYIG